MKTRQLYCTVHEHQHASHPQTSLKLLPAISKCMFRVLLTVALVRLWAARLVRRTRLQNLPRKSRRRRRSARKKSDHESTGRHALRKVTCYACMEVRYGPVRYSTVGTQVTVPGTVRYGTVRIRYLTVRYRYRRGTDRTVPDRTVLYSKVLTTKVRYRYVTVPYNTVRYRTILYRTVLQYRTVYMSDPVCELLGLLYTVRLCTRYRYI